MEDAGDVGGVRERGESKGGETGVPTITGQNWIFLGAQSNK